MYIKIEPKSFVLGTLIFWPLIQDQLLETMPISFRNRLNKESASHNTNDPINFYIQLILISVVMGEFKLGDLELYMKLNGYQEKFAIRLHNGWRNKKRIKSFYINNLLVEDYLFYRTANGRVGKTKYLKRVRPHYTFYPTPKAEAVAKKVEDIIDNALREGPFSRNLKKFLPGGELYDTHSPKTTKL